MSRDVRPGESGRRSGHRANALSPSGNGQPPRYRLASPAYRLETTIQSLKDELTLSKKLTYRREIVNRRSLPEIEAGVSLFIL